MNTSNRFRIARITLGFTVAAALAYGWDAGPSECRTDECSGRTRGNTHLWIVNRALSLLTTNANPRVSWAGFYLAQQGQCNLALRRGVWDADDGILADTFGGPMGSHFYNAAGLDYNGQPTSIPGYLFPGPILLPMGAFDNARTRIAFHLSRIGDLSQPSQCYDLGLALHYLTDLTQPMHTSGMSAIQWKLSAHPNYEEAVGPVQNHFPIDASFDFRWFGLPPDAVLFQTAIRSNGYIKPLLAGIDRSAYLGDEAVTGLILRDAYQSTASFLYSVMNNLPPATNSAYAAPQNSRVLRDPLTGIIYFITNDNRRLRVPDPPTFNALGFLWTEVRDDTNVTAYKDAGSYPHLEPGQLPRNPNTGAIYVVQRGLLRWVKDMDSFYKMGLRVENLVTVPAENLANLPGGYPIGYYSLLFNGALVNDPASGRVYFMWMDLRWSIPNPETFNALGLSWLNIRTDAVIASVPDGGEYPSLRAGKLPRNPVTGAVYVLEAGFKRHVPDPQTFNVLGLNWANIQDMSVEELNKIPEGPPLPSR